VIAWAGAEASTGGAAASGDHRCSWAGAAQTTRTDVARRGGGRKGADLRERGRRAARRHRRWRRTTRSRPLGRESVGGLVGIYSEGGGGGGGRVWMKGGEGGGGVRKKGEATCGGAPTFS
jgi:hypothetical protein